MPRHYTNPNKNNYRSNFERSIAANLTRRGIKFEYEPHSVKYYLDVHKGKCADCGSKNILECHTYTPDFLLENGVYIEAKGNLTPSNRTKMIAVKECNPEMDIRFLFMRDNYLTKKKLITYSEWCMKNDYQFAFMKIPQEWC